MRVVMPRAESADDLAVGHRAKFIPEKFNSNGSIR
jgi:hypothetical protein